MAWPRSAARRRAGSSAILSILVGELGELGGSWLACAATALVAGRPGYGTILGGGCRAKQDRDLAEARRAHVLPVYAHGWSTRGAAYSSGAQMEAFPGDGGAPAAAGRSYNVSSMAAPSSSSCRSSGASRSPLVILPFACMVQR